MPVVPATLEAEVGEPLDSRLSRLSGRSSSVKIYWVSSLSLTSI